MTLQVRSPCAPGSRGTSVPSRADSVVASLGLPVISGVCTAPSSSSSPDSPGDVSSATCPGVSAPPGDADPSPVPRDDSEAAPSSAGPPAEPGAAPARPSGRPERGGREVRPRPSSPSLSSRRRASSLRPAASDRMAAHLEAPSAAASRTAGSATHAHPITEKAASAATARVANAVRAEARKRRCPAARSLARRAARRARSWAISRTRAFSRCAARAPTMGRRPSSTWGDMVPPAVRCPDAEAERLR